MRLLVMTAMATALLTMPAQAQAPAQAPGQAPGQSLPKMDNSAWDDVHSTTTKADEGAYKSALDRIPAPSKQSADPWGDVRPKSPANNQR
jgi:hypothetical protein